MKKNDLKSNVKNDDIRILITQPIEKLFEESLCNFTITLSNYHIHYFILKNYIID